MSDTSASPRALQPHGATPMVGADMVRIAACFSVISIHFLLNIGFYNAPIKGTNMYIMLVMRMLFSVCVPLFIILTGYLMVNRKLSLSHYGKGMKVVWIYVLASLACIIFKIYLQTPHIEDPKAWENSLKDLLLYRAAPYAWYIEMYFGLYLLTPFLASLYRSLPSRRWKIVLIVSLMALNTIPKFLNSFNFETPDWWSHPTLSDDYLRVFPRWWYYNTYPLGYFFIGAYLREYGLRLNGIVHRALILLTLGLSTLFQLWRSDGGGFSWGLGSEWDFLLTVILSTLVFALIVQKPYRHVPQPVAKALHYISGLTLSMFMVSYIFDTLFYKILNQKVPSMPDRLLAYFIIVPAVFVSSGVLSVVIDLIYRAFAAVCSDIKSKLIGLRKPRGGEPPHGGSDAPADTQDATAETQEMTVDGEEAPADAAQPIFTEAPTAPALSEDKPIKTVPRHIKEN